MDQVARAEPGDRDRRARDAGPRRACSGVEFVEFAADESEAQELAALLATLGFPQPGAAQDQGCDALSPGRHQHRHQHREGGLAHSSYLMHGTSAYAIGLKVDDAAATVARARALGARPLRAAARPGRARHSGDPRRRRRRDLFPRRQERARARLGRRVRCRSAGDGAQARALISIDHVAQSMSYEEMLTWLLFYISIFRTYANRRWSTSSIRAAWCAARSSKATARRCGSRLNGAENRQNACRPFLRRELRLKRAAPGVPHERHIRDGEALARHRIRSADDPAELLRRSRSALRLGADLSARLRSLSILYDRDEQGEYFQLYSRTYGDGFFFEIVERRNGYRGYGAPNAPFRIAAQQRAIQQAHGAF